MDEIAELLLLSPDFVGQQIHRLIARQWTKLVVEHETDIVFAIIDDAVCHLVPKCRHGDSPVELRIGGSISLGEEVEAVDGILAVARAVAKGPAPLVAHRIDDSHTDGFLEPEQLTCDDCSARQWAS